MSRQFESNLQQTCVKWFRYQYPKLNKCLFAIPNEGKRNPKNASRMYAEGMLAGVSDLFLAIPKGCWHGFFIEMKWDKNILTNKQKEFQEAVGKVGYRVIVIRSFDEFKNQIEKYLNE